MGIAFGPIGDSAVLNLTKSSQTVALGALPANAPALRLQSLNASQTAWYVKFGTSGAITVSVTDGMRVVPGGQDAPVVVPIPIGSTHFAILAEGADGAVLASYGGYDETQFAPFGSSQVLTVSATDQRIALPTLGTTAPSIRIVATSPGIESLWIKLGDGTVTGSRTTSMKVAPGTVENPTIIPVTAGQTHLSYFCDGVGGSAVLSGGEIDYALPYPLSRSGDRWGVMPFVDSSGAMEIGNALDFHLTDADTSDFGVRLSAGATGLTLNNSAAGNSTLTIIGQGNGGLEIGRVDGTGSTPFIDFHSGATATDFDSRIIATGGSGIDGGGTLNLQAASVQANGWNLSGMLLASGSASGVATVDIVLTAFTGFEALLIQLQRVIPATDDTQLRMRTSTNGGSSYDAGASDYGYATRVLNEAGTSFNTGAASAAFIGLSAVAASNSLSNDAGATANFSLVLPNRKTTTTFAQVTWFGGNLNTGGGTMTINGDAFRKASQDVDAVRFFQSAGNISLNYRVYGLL